MSKEKVYARKRQWLNPIESYNSGAIDYEVTAYKEKSGATPYVSSDFSIWDCNRKISLDFSFGTEKGAKHVTKKVDILIAALQDVKASLGMAYEDFDEGSDDEE